MGMMWRCCITVKLLDSDKSIKMAGYPKITTIEQYFDLIESYVQANPTMPDGTKIYHLRYFVMTGGILP